ncbi:MAG: hypothetical protein V4527_18795, partial [Pseudomonadota bacterium]
RKTKEKVGKPLAQGVIEGFMDELTANRANFGSEMNKVTAELATSMVLGIQATTAASGKSIATALDKVVSELRKEGVENWRELGDDLAGAIHDALIAKTPEARDAALDMMDAISDTIDEAIKAKHTALAGLQKAMADASGKAQAQQTFGVAAPVSIAFGTAMTSNLDKDAVTLNTKLSDLIATLQKNQVPHWEETGQALEDAMLQAVMSGSEEDIAAFNGLLADAAQQNVATLEAAKPKAKAAIEHFWDAITEVSRSDEWVKSMGVQGSAAVSNLFAAMSATTDQEAGAIATKGANAIQTLIGEARRAGVPDASAAGAAIMDAWATAFASKAPEDIAHVQELIGGLWSQIESRDKDKIKLSADSFSASFAQSMSAQGNLARFGTAGVALMDAAITAINKGGQQAIDRFGDTAAQLAGEWRKNLKPGEAEQAVAELMAAVKAVTEGGGAEAIAALDGVIATWQQHAKGFKPGEALAAWSNGIAAGITTPKARLTQALDAFHAAMASGDEKAAKQAETDAEGLVQGIIGTITTKLGPQKAAAVIGPFMTAFQNAILDGSDGSIQAFMTMLSTLETQFQLHLDKMTATYNAAKDAVGVPL